MDQTVVVATRQATQDFSMLKLNDTAADIWDGIAAGLAPDALAQQLATKYEIGEDQARADVDDFIAKLEQLNILE